MKSRDIIKFIAMAKHIEEEAVSTLSGQVFAACEWFKGSNEEVQTIKNGLKILEKESKHHIEVLNAVEAMIRKEGKDVY